ncbi:hypothetical protein SSTU70S_02834 [Stutzerimonas stutzeri]
MTMTYSAAKAAVKNLVDKYLPYPQHDNEYREYFYNRLVDTIGRSDPAARDGDWSNVYTETLRFLVTSDVLDGSGTAYWGLQPEEIFERMSADEFVNLYYSGASASDKLAVKTAFENGSLTGLDLVEGIGLASTGSAYPSAASVIDKAGDFGSVSDLPEAYLPFAGLNDSQKDFLVSIYVAAFNRAPEYEGLKFWAGDMAKAMQSGHSEKDAFFFIGDAMYDAGERNGEGGTDLPNASYVNYAYNNALGRNADTSGYDFWLKELNSGAVERGDFLTTFLTGVEDGQRDALFLDARLAVASHAAQEHVSGKGAPGIDAREIMAGVVDNATALSKINFIQDHFGLAQVSLSGIGSEVEFWG